MTALNYSLNGFARPFRRLHEREDSEHEQALLRIVIVAIVLAYMWITYTPVAESNSGAHSEPTLVVGLAIALITAIGIFVAVCIWPAKNVFRRSFGMVADVSAASFCMFLAGEAGTSMMGVYLFITLGNGFRYGRAYLFVCQGMCIAAFIGVLALSPYWQVHLVAGISLLVALVVIPLYVSTLLRRVQEATTRANEASAAKSLFLANMSHEIRTPLNGIVGIVDLLQTTRLDDQQIEFIRLLRNSTKILRSLVDDVLDISKIESGRLIVTTSDFDLHALINDLVRTLQINAKAKGVTLYTCVDPCVDYRARGDVSHLQQVLLNLVANAIKFTERGEVVLVVKLLSETVDSMNIRVEVRDTGIGISPEAQRRIFERFVQADGSTHRRYGGSGLGITIAKQLVELMGGQIGVSSVVGIGSTFWFELPLAKSAALATPRHEEPPGSVTLLCGTSPTVEQLRATVSEVCGAMESFDRAEDVLLRFRELQEQRTTVGAIVVAADVDVAIEIFERIVRERGNATTGLVYVRKENSDDVEMKRLQQMEGVSCVPPRPSPQVLHNAIHAASRRTTEGAQIIDLAEIIRAKRQPLRILVAEDNPTNQVIICRLLEQAGHTIVLAEDGERALDIYESNEIDIAIVDDNMPNRTGQEVVSAIRTMEMPGVRLPMIVLSANTTPETRKSALRRGADEFIGKPFDAKQLLDVVDRLARRASRSERGAAPSRGVTQMSGFIPTNATVLLDFDKVSEVERIGGDGTFFASFLAVFRNDVERLLTRIDAALAMRNIGEVIEAEHAMRGVALGIGAMRLAGCCSAIQKTVASGEINAVESLANELRRCAQQTFEQLDAYLATRGRSQVGDSIN